MQPASLLSLSVLLLTALTAAEPTNLDRQRLIAHLGMTEQALAAEVKSLSPTQLKFRPSEQGWSVLDCVEHLAIAEPQYWADYQKSMKEEASPSLKSRVDDAYMLWYGIDRTSKAKTGEARVPQSRYKDVETPLAEFRKLRATMIEYAKTTNEDWRHHDFQGGEAYQWFLMISSHAQRHILQIREIKSHTDFPKS